MCKTAGYSAALHSQYSCYCDWCGECVWFCVCLCAGSEATRQRLTVFVVKSILIIYHFCELPKLLDNGTLSEAKQVARSHWCAVCCSSAYCVFSGCAGTGPSAPRAVLASITHGVVLLLH